jgi:chromosome partitioning protein
MPPGTKPPVTPESPLLEANRPCTPGTGAAKEVTAGLPDSRPGPPPKERLWDRWDKLHRTLDPQLPPEDDSLNPAHGSPFIVSVINQKGGTGKTTTTINLSAALAYLGYRTLMVDLDPQGHATIGIGVDPDSFIESMADVMGNQRQAVADIVLSTYVSHLWLAPARIHLAHVAEQIYSRVFREAILHQALKDLHYDFIFIDCPPSLGVLTINALYASDFIITPCQMSRYSLEGLADLLVTIEMVKNLDPQELFRRQIFRILLTMFDKRNRVTNDYILEEISPYRTMTFATRIVRNEAINQAQIEQKAVFDFDPESSGTRDYGKLAVEFLQLYHNLTGAAPFFPRLKEMGE